MNRLLITLLLLIPLNANAGVVYHEASPAPAVKKPFRSGYPTRRNLWSHPGEIHAHLLSGEHRGKFDPDWIRLLSKQEAESLHSDDHDGRVQWKFVVRPGWKTSEKTTTKTACPT